MLSYGRAHTIALDTAPSLTVPSEVVKRAEVWTPSATGRPVLAAWWPGPGPVGPVSTFAAAP